MITKLTKHEHWQLIGLLTLAKEHMRNLKEIEESLYSLFEVQEIDNDNSGIGDPDHIGDAIYSDYSVKELLGKLGVKLCRS